MDGFVKHGVRFAARTDFLIEISVAGRADLQGCCKLIRSIDSLGKLETRPMTRFRAYVFRDIGRYEADSRGSITVDHLLTEATG